MAILISVQAEFRERKLTRTEKDINRDKEDRMIKGTLQQEDPEILNVYVPNQSHKISKAKTKRKPK